MTHLFFDTSAIAKRYAVEPGTDTVDHLIESSDSTVLITSLTIVELASALRRKQNRDALSRSDVDRLLTVFFRESLEEFTIVALDETRFEQALDLVLEDDLRTLDSLQLAAALEVNADLECQFVCADDDLISVADTHGLETIDPTADDPLAGISLGNGRDNDC
ncbi:type II toxin-antitoxin system VapC family toxin [Natranaeroarchaeum aerophilus]|uniref:Type II toxin-antitoxin system VapC family toxin n=1 Tax=Natranaeroarchaeum aerophilus TaxID=2917711 RepID=A0AAE3FMX7_9EURY|nr:type II toxin-antitoxin system VapC family toxin [Natranaeroarchaeum aerophilus]MCL9812045.1 type II toxin-antitoxin system VapC family toxin [Natranaeroarchaeum aerophilus]